MKRNISKKVIYKPLMGCSLFSNSHFQMGVTVMGFAEHFGHRISLLLLETPFSLEGSILDSYNMHIMICIILIADAKMNHLKKVFKRGCSLYYGVFFTIWALISNLNYKKESLFFRVVFILDLVSFINIKDLNFFIFLKELLYFHELWNSLK